MDECLIIYHFAKVLLTDYTKQARRHFLNTMFNTNFNTSSFVNEIDALVKKGKVLLNEGKFESALGFFEQALLLDQNNPELWNYKGIALRSIGRYNEAIECFNKSLEINPRDKKAS